MTVRTRRERGQATVELVGLVVAMLMVGLLAIQGITVAQTASIAQEAARNGARSLSTGGDWQDVVDQAVGDELVHDLTAAVDDGTASVRVTVTAPLGVAGMDLVDVSLTRTAAFPVEG
ncbi:TadE family protein [Promicromonospora sp. NPDC023987]|uniref:TadE/TadG family type IV pilus assembly protein n=1 Tax=Promicromonospora sp. NPDC023987 TaxID=3155360 RepID=UPI0033F18BD7